MAAEDLAQSIYEWSRNRGVLAERTALPAGESQRLAEVADGDPDALEYAEARLAKALLVGVVADDENNEVTVLTKGALGPRIIDHLPSELNNLAVAYVGGADLVSNPPPAPVAALLPQAPYHIHDGRIACGSSVTAAPIYGAGTWGCLANTEDGTLCGLTNNHVTGDCNHTLIGMHILSPAPMDADPNGPSPTGIGKHRSFVPLRSGDPQQVQLQELDVALFGIGDPDQVSSMQGAGSYDTPIMSVNPAGKMRVKKVGRTTGLTKGRIVGRWVTPLGIPYRSDRFSSIVHFTGAWAIKGRGGEPFSNPGDSGSLVVSDDGEHAVGLIFAGAGPISLMMPIEAVLRELRLTLVGGHNA